MLDEFISNKKTYRINITLNNNLGFSDTLDAENLDMFSYENEMNRLYTEGYIEYTDSNAILDKFIESQYVTCKVTFEKLLIKRDGDTETKTIEQSITLNFTVDNFEILDNQPGTIRYRINLIGDTYNLLNKDVRHTTYGDKKQSTTGIIMQILQNYTKIGVNVPSFSSNDSGVMIDYITENNDNTFSAIDFLMNKTCYSDFQHDKSIKSLVLDEGSNVVFLFDTGKNGKKLGFFRSPIEIRVFKGAMEYNNDVPVYVGYVSRKGKIDSILNMRKINYYKYDIDSNAFSPSTFQEDSIKKVFSGDSNSNSKMFVNLGNGFDDYEGEWNNNIKKYSQLFDALTKTNGLIVNQYGEIGTIPGFSCNVSIPTAFPTPNLFSSSTNQYLSQKLKYQSFTGKWDIFKVEHFISPKKQMFRQKLVLYRNEI